MTEHGYADVNGQHLHYAAAGAGPLMLFLHGFPEFWYAWRRQLAAFQDVARVVAPDMRGYNRSSKPGDVQDYALPALVADVAGLVAHFGERSATVVGHDWGGVVAWATAQARPDLVDRLVIINAPHPAIFRRELRHNPAQRRASAYTSRLRDPAAEAALSRDGYAALLDIRFPPQAECGPADEEDRRAYLEAWSQRGALTAALNYYRAADHLLGLRDIAPPEADPAETPVAAPTLVIWGEDDTALLTGNLLGLEQYVPRLRVELVPGASHWIVHERPEIVNMLIRSFVFEPTGDDR